MPSPQMEAGKEGQYKMLKGKQDSTPGKAWEALLGGRVAPPSECQPEEEALHGEPRPREEAGTLHEEQQKQFSHQAIALDDTGL